MSSASERLSEALHEWGEAGGPEARAPETREAARGLLSCAEELLAAGAEACRVAPPLLHGYLEATGRPAFLSALEDREERRRWAETAFGLVRRSDYRLEDMLRSRAREIGDRPYLEELANLRLDSMAPTAAGGNGEGAPAWTYARVLRRARAIATLFLELQPAPRVALYLDNSVDGACCDLACLLHDILVSPLSTNIDADDLTWIFDRLGINLVVTDREERLRRLLEVRERVAAPFEILALRPGPSVERGDARLFAGELARVLPAQVDEQLRERPRFGLDDVCTVMFTSGSTGRPKGVAFSPYHLVTKRFGRAAALPTVGREEKLLSFLPLFHTFGRFLEMLGMLFWRGTYVFAGNPSAETLMAGMRLVRPTGLISIPMRWAQLRDRALHAADPREGEQGSGKTLEQAFAETTGGRLRWGLSAAGYLDPRVFRFFQSHGVALCSGFGMTEATGGITMSPPGEYFDDTVGIPLPGMRLRQTEQGELLIGGEYVAGYLREGGSGLELEEPLVLDGLPWLPTGDIFQTLAGGHWTIVDRIKDIYKNSRGQTIAPRRVEREFEGVPGIRRTFLVGDRRPHNTLLIVPDTLDAVLFRPTDRESREGYFNLIVGAANERLAGFERVVRYALVDRDFEAERGELTPKGSLRRKVIEENFADVIEDLYRRRHVELRVGELQVVVPHPIYRDLGMLEDELVATPDGLRDRRRSRDLPIRHLPEESAVQVGDLVYDMDGERLDLGILARQPRLWIGNPALMRFLVCKDGWDVALGPFRSRVLRPARGGAAEDQSIQVVDPEGIDDPQLLQCNRLVQETLFGNENVAQRALTELSSQMDQYDPRLDIAVRQRIKALAGHASQRLRCQAYRVLLTDRPAYGYDEAFGAFIRSGLPFLDEESIHVIASSHLGVRRLDALRQRLHRYRHELEWPAGDVVRRQFEDMLTLLTDFVRYHPRSLKPVRSELACWILHRADPELARFAEDLMREMITRFERDLESEDEAQGRRLLPAQIAFDDNVPDERRERLVELLCTTSFLRHSLMLTSDEWSFDPRDVPESGVWISPHPSAGRFANFRVSINSRQGRHYSLLVVLGIDADVQRVRDTNFHMMKIASHPFEPRAIPRMGALRPERAALSLEFVDEPNLEERIRHYTGIRASHRQAWEAVDWRRLFVRAIAGIFRAWSYGGERIVPGTVRPTNVIVPELDSNPNCFLVSLGGWTPYAGPLDLFRPLLVSFYLRTVAHHPVCDGLLSLDWIFEGCLEGLPEGRGMALLRELRDALESTPDEDPAARLSAPLDAYLRDVEGSYQVPLLLQTAIDRFHRWRRINPEATVAAQVDEAESLIRLYQLDPRDELVRYHLFRHTCFADRNPAVLECFDRLLAGLAAQPDRPVTELVELSDLQEALVDAEERECFGRMVFPRVLSPASAEAEVLSVDWSGRRRLALRTWISDRQGGRYAVREALDAEEVGHAYRLFLREHCPLRVSELDHQLLALDDAERIIAALMYHFQEPEVVHLSGMVVASSLTSRGIATAFLDDFLDRMSNRGARVVKTGFMLHEFGRRRGFTVDPRWGGQVRFIGDRADSPGEDRPAGVGPAS